jgi:hypothetical protein
VASTKPSWLIGIGGGGTTPATRDNIKVSLRAYVAKKKKRLTTGVVLLSC